MKFWPFKKKVITESTAEVESQTTAVPTSEPMMDEVSRVANYFASGGEIVDLSNKPRLPNDGFASDSELIQPYNQAHYGTKKGLASMGRRGR